MGSLASAVGALRMILGPHLERPWKAWFPMLGRLWATALSSNQHSEMGEGQSNGPMAARRLSGQGILFPGEGTLV
jgi:hypothetical protein